VSAGVFMYFVIMGTVIVILYFFKFKEALEGKKKRKKSQIMEI
jgi:hypothetical protein